MESNLNDYKDWLFLLRKVENHFEKQGFLRVQTPNLVFSGAMEATLETFKIEGAPYYLPTSPEFALKKLWLSGLSDKIYEISQSFRREDVGGLHLPEFTMLEFYRSEAKLTDLKEEVQSWLMSSFSLSGQMFKTCRLNEIFYDFTGFELKPDSDEDFLKSVLEFHGLYHQESYSWNDLFQVIYINLIEPLLSYNSVVFLENYPPQLSALAKINSDGWAERVEVFYKGVELGNGYDEVFDAQETQRRWDKENTARLKADLPSHPVDQELIEISSKTQLKQGVGIAIGLERVFSLFLKEGTAESSIKTWPFGC